LGLLAILGVYRRWFGHGDTGAGFHAFETADQPRLHDVESGLIPHLKTAAFKQRG
jgi:hypothetical protein